MHMHILYEMSFIKWESSDVHGLCAACAFNYFKKNDYMQ